MTKKSCTSETEGVGGLLRSKMTFESAREVLRNDLIDVEEHILSYAKRVKTLVHIFSNPLTMASQEGQNVLNTHY